MTENAKRILNKVGKATTDLIRKVITAETGWKRKEWI